MIRSQLGAKSWETGIPSTKNNAGKDWDKELCHVPEQNWGHETHENRSYRLEGQKLSNISDSYRLEERFWD